MTNMSTKLTFERSIESTLLIDLFAKAEPGQLVTHEQMNATIGKSGTANAMNYTIRKALMDEHDRVLEAVPGEGYRVALPETVASGFVTKQRRRAHNLFHRSMKALATVHRDSLPTDADKRDYDVKASLVAMLEYATSNRSEKKVAKALEGKSTNGDAALLATAQTLEALKK